MSSRRVWVVALTGGLAAGITAALYPGNAIAPSNADTHPRTEQFLPRSPGPTKPIKLAVNRPGSSTELTLPAHGVTPEDFESRLLSFYASGAPDSAKDDEIRAVVDPGIKDTFGAAFEYQVECRITGCLISSDTLNSDGAGLCDVVPYKANWTSPIWCAPGGTQVYLFRGQPPLR